MDDSEQLQMALCTLANDIGLSDMCILRLILLDVFKIQKTSALDYFTDLQNLEKITITDVSIVYEILFLMGKKVLWTKFRRTLVDDGGNVHDNAYDVEKKSTHFSDFRRTMIKIGQQFTGDLDSLSMMYEIPKDVTGIWMKLLHLDDKRKVNSAEKASLLKFKKKLTVAGSPQAGRIIQQYVERNFSSKHSQAREQMHSESERKPINAPEEKMDIYMDDDYPLNTYSDVKLERNVSSQNNQATDQMHSESELRKPINATERSIGLSREDINTFGSDVGRSLEIDNLTIEVEKIQQRVETMKKKVCHTTEECSKTIIKTGEQLKNKIDFCVSTQIDDLENMKANKLQKLDQIAIDLEAYSQQIEEMRNALEPQIPSCDSLNLERFEDSLSELYPEVHGYFNRNNKNISKDLNKFKDNVSKYYVDYKPVDPDKCSVNFLDLNNRCFNINETIRLEVFLNDSQDNHVSEEHESAPVKVSAQLQDLENSKSNNYEVSKIPGQKFPTFEFKFTNTGLWKLCVFVCGEMVPKPINLKILSDEEVKTTIPLNTEEFKGGPIFDVCFTSNGKYLLACNFTDTIFSFGLKSLRFFSVGENKKIANLCCIDDGRVFLTETTEREIVVLDHKFNVREQFGKDNFKDGSPQGIAATCKHGAVHVFVSDNKSKCVQHYVNQVLIDTIVNLPTPDKRTITPWFLDVNRDLQLFICNNTSSSYQKHSNQKNICYVEVIDMNSKTLVNSLKCDSAVCIDEQCNVFLGMNIGVKMFDKNLEFIKEFACNCDGSYGLSAFNGCLAVVFPGSIKLYQYAPPSTT